MITSQHSQLLREANGRQDAERRLQRVLHEEIGMISPLSKTQKDALCDALSSLNVPTIAVIENKTACHGNPDSRRTSTAAAIITFAGAAITGAAAGYIGIVGALLVALAMGIAAFFLMRMTVGNAAAPTCEATINESVDTDRLVSCANSIVDNLRHLADTLSTDLPKSDPNTKPLHAVYPNVLKWLQNLYVDNADNGEENLKRVLKRIDSLAYQCKYELVLFDGENQKMFQTNADKDLTEPVMIAPGFRYAPTGVIVLPGLLAVPES